MYRIPVALILTKFVVGDNRWFAIYWIIGPISETKLPNIWNWNFFISSSVVKFIWVPIFDFPNAVVNWLMNYVLQQPFNGSPPHLWNMPISIRVKSKNVCDNLDLELLHLNGLGDLRMVENLEFWTEKLSEEVDILFFWGKTFVFDSNSEVSVEPALSRSKNLKIRT